jgi:hypothetical protein
MKTKQKVKLCECGCGLPAPIATQNNKKAGHIKGQPMRYRRWHHWRKTITKHGMSRTPEHIAFHNAKQRCRNPKASGYERYGGIGVRFRFRSFVSFFKHVGLKPSAKHSLDRIDANGDYCRGNIRWSTASVQRLNRRNK